MNVIEIDHLYKQYRLGQVGTGTLVHDLNRWYHRIRGLEDPYERLTQQNDRRSPSSNSYVWALEDICCQIKQGDVTGIIGKNGAGKSTLLKLLSKVTSPTRGSIRIRGKVASLLEVGTGFHPELTGRENIFLNGAILGMTKREIAQKFDEIVAFSGVEKYIDTPVKRYSSGMYVRLAFAVAAHLEPEILIVDEVLAVGDAEFQKKCLGKMQDVSKEGRTVLFVSHNLVAVQSLCNKGILLEHGRLSFEGTANDAVDKYLASQHATLQSSIDFSATDLHAPGAEGVFLRHIGISPTQPNVDQAIELRIRLSSSPHFDAVYVAFDLISPTEEVVFGSGNKLTNRSGELDGICHIPANLMNDGIYSINLYVMTGEMRALFSVPNAIQFEVIDRQRDHSYFGKINGAVRPKLEWTLP
jgi:lipopolysaccharide transport system ATP-binding protein